MIKWMNFSQNRMYHRRTYMRIRKKIYDKNVSVYVSTEMNTVFAN